MNSLQVLVLVLVFKQRPLGIGAIHPSVDNINGWNTHSIRKVNASNVVSIRARVCTCLGPALNAAEWYGVGGGGGGGGGGENDGTRKEMKTS